MSFVNPAGSVDRVHVTRIQIPFKIVFTDAISLADLDRTNAAGPNQPVHSHLRNTHTLSSLRGSKESRAAGRDFPRQPSSFR